MVLSKGRVGNRNFSFLSNCGRFGDLKPTAVHIPVAHEPVNLEEQPVVAEQEVSSVPVEATYPAPASDDSDSDVDIWLCVGCPKYHHGECSAAHVHVNKTVPCYVVVTT